MVTLRASGDFQKQAGVLGNRDMGGETELFGSMRTIPVEFDNGRYPACQPDKPRPPGTGRLGAKNNRIGAMPTLEKSTNEWVESRFEAVGSHRKWDRRSS